MLIYFLWGIKERPRNLQNQTWTCLLKKKCGAFFRNFNIKIRKFLIILTMTNVFVHTDILSEKKKKQLKTEWDLSSYRLQMGRQWATWDPDTFLMWSSQILKLRIFHIKKYLETSVFLEKLEFFRTGVAIIRYSPAGAPPLYWFALSRSHNS